MFLQCVVGRNRLLLPHYLRDLSALCWWVFSSAAGVCSYPECFISCFKFTVTVCMMVCLNQSYRNHIEYEPKIKTGKWLFLKMLK